MKNIAQGLLLFISCCLISGSVLAMDMDLWNAPIPEGAQIIYKDMPAQVNSIEARLTHLSIKGPQPQEIMDFYKDQMQKSGWQIKDDFRDQNVLAFIKDKKYFYVGVRYSMKNIPLDIYLVSSPGDLAICRMLKDYVLQKEIAGDTPGRDPYDIPRYPDAKRRLNIGAPEEGNILFYESEANVADVASFYDQQLSLVGWQRKQAFELDRAKKAIKDIDTRGIEIMLFEKGEDSLVVNIYSMPMEGNKRTLITITKNIGEIISPLKQE